MQLLGSCTAVHTNGISWLLQGEALVSRAHLSRISGLFVLSVCFAAACVAMPCSSVLSVLLLPTVIVASWYISYADTSAWAPAAMAILTSAVAVSWWQDRSSKPAAAGSSGREGSSFSPDATLQLIKNRRSVFPKDFTGAVCDCRKRQPYRCTCVRVSCHSLNVYPVILVCRR